VERVVLNALAKTCGSPAANYFAPSANITHRARRARSTFRPQVERDLRARCLNMRRPCRQLSAPSATITHRARRARSTFRPQVERDLRARCPNMRRPCRQLFCVFSEHYSSSSESSIHLSLSRHNTSADFAEADSVAIALAPAGDR
jgi:hypothetical protein